MSSSDILIIAPIILIEIGLAIAAMVDLVRRKKVAGDNKLLWGAVILFIGIIGPIVYFIFGRKED
jgi:hypothetical protein